MQDLWQLVQSTDIGTTERSVGYTPQQDRKGGTNLLTVIATVVEHGRAGVAPLSRQSTAALLLCCHL